MRDVNGGMGDAEAAGRAANASAEEELASQPRNVILVLRQTAPQVGAPKSAETALGLRHSTTALGSLWAGPS